ncbi:hypothetical protein, partial [Ruminococcus sp.]|uniref:hypothetical protein n=1 Tax=Ruminococcus sp. TaxID=41978 RepID=UPI002E77FD06
MIPLFFMYCAENFGKFTLTLCPKQSIINSVIVTIQNDKKLYTCTKEILKYRIAGMQMIEIQIGRMLCSPEALKTPLKNQVRQN